MLTAKSNARAFPLPTSCLISDQPGSSPAFLPCYDLNFAQASQTPGKLRVPAFPPVPTEGLLGSGWTSAVKGA